MKTDNRNFITELEPNEVIIFGSNSAGGHHGGLAKQCVDDFGAIMGVGFGRQGKCYAIPTLNENFEKLPLEIIKHYLNELADYARLYKGEIFYLTAIGQGIANFTKEEMESIMPIFPDNVIKLK